jgi:sporulation protein YlmC with PRC-barrel domain
MHAKLLLAGVMTAALMSPAAAQTNRANSPGAAPAPQNQTTTTATTPRTHASMWRASKLVGVDVYNEQNEKLGDISEVLIDKSGKVAGVVIGVGGFLGMGQRDIMVEMSKLKFMDEPVRASDKDKRPGTTGTTSNSAARSNDRNWYPDHAVLTGVANKDALKNMPEFKYD